jgi:YfiH family protein
VSRTTSTPAWTEADWSAAPAGVRAISTYRSGEGGVSTGPYSSLNLARHVGDSDAAVTANRAWLRTAARLPDEPLWLEQVHGIDVVEHRGEATARAPRADAAVAFEARRVCAVMTADCLPVVFVDRRGTRIAVAHAGWRGLVGGVLEATVAALDVKPGELMAWLGPAISQPAFEVGSEVRAAFVERHVAHAAAFERNAHGRYQADLYLLAHQALALAGVVDVSGGGRCTVREAGQFFSYRRDGGRTGRMATVAWLEEEEPPLSTNRFRTVNSRTE